MPRKKKNEEATQEAIKEQVALIPNKVYKFTATVSKRGLVDGKVYEVTGVVASELVNKGLGNITE